MEIRQFRDANKPRYPDQAVFHVKQMTDFYLTKLLTLKVQVEGQHVDENPSRRSCGTLLWSQAWPSRQNHQVRTLFN